MKICFLASGGGGNLKFMYLIKELGIMSDIELSVIADRECDSIRFALDNKIYGKIIMYSKDNNQNLIDELSKINPDIIVTNWHKILDEEIVERYTGKLLNLHYSLLPSFGGLIGTAPIEKAYEQGCKYVGATCHYVDKGVDTGKIISQAIVKTDISIESAIEEVFRKGCLILLNSMFLTFKQETFFETEIKQYDFSPALKFDNTLCDENFWKRLKKL